VFFSLFSYPWCLIFCERLRWTAQQSDPCPAPAAMPVPSHVQKPSSSLCGPMASGFAQTHEVLVAAHCACSGIATSMSEREQRRLETRIDGLSLDEMLFMTLDVFSRAPALGMTVSQLISLTHSASNANATAQSKADPSNVRATVASERGTCACAVWCVLVRRFLKASSRCARANNCVGQVHLWNRAVDKRVYPMCN